MHNILKSVYSNSYYDIIKLMEDLKCFDKDGHDIFIKSAKTKKIGMIFIDYKLSRSPFLWAESSLRPIVETKFKSYNALVALRSSIKECIHNDDINMDIIEKLDAYKELFKGQAVLYTLVLDHMDFIKNF